MISLPDIIVQCLGRARSLSSSPVSRRSSISTRRSRCCRFSRARSTHPLRRQPDRHGADAGRRARGADCRPRRGSRRAAAHDRRIRVRAGDRHGARLDRGHAAAVDLLAIRAGARLAGHFRDRDRVHPRGVAGRDGQQHHGGLCRRHRRRRIRRTRADGRPDERIDMASGVRGLEHGELRRGGGDLVAAAA